MIFVNSMSDLFHKDVRVEYIVAVAEVMRRASWHTFQVLTKRSDRMRDLLKGPLRFAAQLPNVWWGVSVENRRHGLPRIQHLSDSPAKVRFLSVEPLLEDLGELSLRGIHWVIVGGESGPGARPLDKKWVTSIRDQCHSENVAFFFKQWGGFQKSKAGRELDGRTYDALPDRPVRAVPDREHRTALVEWAETLSLDLQRTAVDRVNTRAVSVRPVALG
jgi:protein gp37